MIRHRGPVISSSEPASQFSAFKLCKYYYNILPQRVQAENISRE